MTLRWTLFAYDMAEVRSIPNYHILVLDELAIDEFVNVGSSPDMRNAGCCTARLSSS